MIKFRECKDESLVEGVFVDDKNCLNPDNALSVERTDFGWLLYVHIVNIPGCLLEFSDIMSSLEKRMHFSDAGRGRLFSKQAFNELYDGNTLPALTLRASFTPAGQVLDSNLAPTRLSYNKPLSRVDFKDVRDILGAPPKHLGRKERMICDLFELAQVLQKRRAKLGAICGSLDGLFYDWLSPKEFSPGVFLVREIRFWADYVLTRLAKKHDAQILYRVQRGPMRQNLLKSAEKIRSIFEGDSGASDSEKIERLISELLKSRKVLHWARMSMSRNSLRNAGIGFPCYAPFLAPRRKLIDLYNLSTLAEALEIQQNPLKGFDKRKICRMG
ncbi:MAG TPA: RNB domain-containing ribonuclease [Oligoflexia bacterium]|nr:RNB domain-containing ribonuclease [Oligoflexia bacterium]HMP49649.1 RNB domain-containing ribonuclease [Oligoflexia bacterium]